MALAEVRTLYSANATEIVKMLRMLADNLEKDQPPNVIHAVCAIRDGRGRIQHYVWGQQTEHEALSLYQCVAHRLLSHIDGGSIHEDQQAI